MTEPTFEYHTQLITLSSAGGGTSRRPGHILLNWRRMFDLVPDVAIASAEVADDSPFVRGLVALYIWNKVWRGAEEELSDVEASVIETLWRDVGRKVEIAAPDAFLLVNGARRIHGLAPLTPGEFDHALARLSGMDCIKVNSGTVWLREWVRRKT